MKIKYIEDYYDQVKERFPDLEKWEIEKILKHGMQSFFMINSKGGDVIIKSAHNSFTMYFGKLFNKKELTSVYSNLKWRIKIRLKYWIKKPIWDGNYYFGLTQEEYDKYIPKKNGRIKNKVEFEKLHAYKIKEECFFNRKAKYFFKLYNIEDEGMTIRKEKFSTRSITFIAKRNSEGKIINING